MFKNKSQRLLLILCLIILLAALAVFGAIVYLRVTAPPPAAPAATAVTAIPTAAEEAVKKEEPLPFPNLLVHLTRPTGQVTIKQGETLAIHGQTVSAFSIHSLELWVDGEKTETRYPVNTERPFFSGIWDWKPKDPGQHKIYLRGLDMNGNTQYSNIAQVTVQGAELAADGSPVLPEVSAPAPGSAPAVEGAMPAVDFFAPPAPNTNPAEGEPTPEAGITPTPTFVIPPPPNPAPPESPFDLQITTSVNGCEHIFNIKDLNNKATRFILYYEAMGFWSTSYSAAALPEGVTITNIEPKQVGTHEYFIKAIGAGNTSFDSPIYKLDITDQTCAAGYDHKTVFADVKLVPRFRTENLTCYTQVNSLGWKLLPADGFLQPISGTEVQVWKDNLKLVDYQFPEPKANEVFDMLPYIADLGAAGTDTYTLWFRCYQTAWEENAEFFDMVAAKVDMKSSKVKVLSGNKMDVYVFFADMAVAPNGGTNNSEGFNLQLAAPENLVAIYDPENCPADVPKLLCQNAFDNNYVAFRWNWKSSPCASTAGSGETACIKEPNRFLFIGPDDITTEAIPYQASETNDFSAFVPYPGDQESDNPVVNALYGITPRTYYTRAESAGIVSQFSNEVTLTNRKGHYSTIKTITLQPSGIGRYITGFSNDGQLTYPNPRVPVKIFAGWNKETNPFEFWQEHGMFHYDLSELEGKFIHSAKLEVINDSTYSWISEEPGFTIPLALDTESDGIPAPARGCAQMVTTLTQYADKGYHSNPPEVRGGTYLNTDSTTSTIDVTDEVLQWLDGSLPNNGFLLWSDLSFNVTGDWTSYGCYTYYLKPDLTIEYSDK